MKRLWCLLIVCGPAVAAAEDVVGYRWLRAIDLPDIKTTSVVAVPLDTDIYEQTQAGQPDMRLRNSQGEVVGFIVRKASESKSHSVRSYWTSEQGSAKVNAETGLQVEFSLRDKEPVPQGIRIITPLRDFEHQVRVESTANGTDWVSAAPPTVIFDYSKYVDARNDVVRLEATDNRRFRLTIEDVTAEQESQLMELQRRLEGTLETGRTERSVIARRPFRIDRIEFYRDETKFEAGKLQLTTYPATDFQVTEDEKRHETVVSFLAQRQPVTKIKIMSDGKNFSRAATVEAEAHDSRTGKPWHKFPPGALTRFSIGAIQRDDVTLTIDETAAAKYRVTIENRDSAPLTVTGVELSGPTYELMFLASPGLKYELHYNSDDDTRGQYDVAALEAALTQHQTIVAAKFQPPQPDPLAAVKASRPWKPWNDTRFLFGAIIALTALLGWGLYRAGSQIAPPPAS